MNTLDGYGINIEGNINMKEKVEVYLTDETVNSLMSRLKRIEGQIRGIQGMLAEKRSCDEILLQLAAVQSALRSVTALLLEGHMETCVKTCALEERDEKALDSLKRVLVQALKII